jgi:ubiquinone/menaquinone biosynthesis C-methylase UbiE
VTGVDFTPNLLSQAREEATLDEADDMGWEGNAKDLPFGYESFDVVVSSFGHMFAQNPEMAMREMLRVLKRGGRVAFTSWPSELVNGKLAEVVARHIPPSPPSASPNSPSPSPMQWGNPDLVEKRLGLPCQRHPF